MLKLNLSYTTCFLSESVADYLCCMPISLIDLCLSGTQIYNSEVLIRSLTRLTNIEHLRLNGLSTINDRSLESVSLIFK